MQYRLRGDSKQEGTIEQVETENGRIVIKNYTPTKPLTTVDQLYTADDVDEEADLLAKIENDGETGGSNYVGDDVISLPQYFDKEFMKLVLQNKGHILKQAD